ncbi:uncharacterized protein LOC142175314 [Nicotiana tabacum]|uniref:Uncharacterized protein LOC142175314 n=1 Tax=Nicotiana tabacum TaxID=4097 RepID=A0AC58TL99_TOBAC
MDAGYNVYFANNSDIIKFNKRFIYIAARSVPSTPAELWTGRKPSLQHIRVWDCPAHVLKGKADKFESRIEVCIFIVYPKGTKGGLFYFPKEKKKLSNGVTNDSSLERILEASIDIPLHYRSGINVNRKQNGQEQLPDISLPQSSGSNVEQPQIIEQPEIVLQPALHEIVNDIPAPQGFTQKEGIDYEEFFLPVAMLKSIKILLSIAAHYDYEIWQMDIKTTFLNESLDECIYMAQPVGFIKSGNEHMLCKLKKSIYGLKQASRAWNTYFDTSIKTFGFDQCENESCVYKKWDGDKVTFLVLYVDDIFLMGNNVSMLNSVKE